MAARVLVSLEEAHLTFGGKPLFAGVDLHVCEGDKICLVGRNGAGKTTLMRLIMGDLELDAGKRFLLPGLTVGYLAQTVDHNPDHTVREFVMTGLRKSDEGDDPTHRADMLMGPLSLDPEATLGTLSGGQLRRAALARALMQDPDVLLLDEPTNHLDLAAIEWLEDYLARSRGALVCVSHDRAFLSAVSRKVFWIDQGIVRTCPGGYAEFDDWAEQVVEQEARELHNLQKKLAAEIDWTQGGVSGRRKRNQRRLNELGRLREKIRADKAAYNQRMRTIETDPLSITPSSKIIAEFKHVTKSFQRNGREIAILKDFSIRILRGDRIGILGHNGSGKSTFIRLLTGEEQPDSGRVFLGKTVEISYFDQHRVDLDPENTIWKTLAPGGGDYVFLGSGENQRPRHVCGYLKDFLFDPRQARDRVSTLSGGQQNRLLLAAMLAAPGNVLILDEPTNDLDMDTLDMLQDILADYNGTLIIVSHDRDFLDRTVTEVLAFEGNAVVESHIGGYSDYVAKKKKPAAAKKPAEKPATSPVSTTPAKPMQRHALSGKQRHELEKLPEKIAGLEEEIKRLHTLLADPDLYTSNPAAFDAASRDLSAAQMELEQAETRWLELEERRQNPGG